MYLGCRHRLKESLTGYNFVELRKGGLLIDLSFEPVAKLTRFTLSRTVSGTIHTSGCFTILAVTDIFHANFATQMKTFVTKCLLLIANRVNYWVLAINAYTPKIKFNRKLSLKFDTEDIAVTTLEAQRRISCIGATGSVTV